MERKFKAFISYRHLPLDAKVAKMLHRRIEHFTVPKDLRENCGKKLGYVFRDQEEMPLSSDLLTNIETALDNSEYLIVICTPETKKSKWVLREIEYFLEHHDRNHVLAVLADGSHAEAFPQQLMQYVSYNGETVNVIEPLAANIAASSSFKRRRLFRTESLRILAALIRCNYDELYKREQRYRTRRILAAVTAALCVAGVFIGTLLEKNREIQKNYDLAVQNYEQSVKNYDQAVENYDLAMSNLNRALRNQSTYLASESLKLLEEGDKLGAAALAIEALPQEGKERPYVSKAEYALGSAVNAYLSPGLADSTVTTGVLQHSAEVKDFCINDGGDTICSLTKVGELTCWDTENYSRRWTYMLPSDKLLSSFDWQLAGYVGEDSFLVWGGHELLCFDLQSGDILWRCAAEEASADGYELDYFKNVQLSENGRIVLFGSIYGDSGVSRKVICFVDPECGKLSGLVSWPELQKNAAKVEIYSINAIISDDGSLAASYYTYEDEQHGQYRGLAVLHLESGELLYCSGGIPETTAIVAMRFADNDSIFYSTWDSLDNFGPYSMGSFNALQYDKCVLHCVDIKSRRISWEHESTFCFPGGNEALFYDPDLTDAPVIVFSYSNHVDLLDAESGKLLAGTEFPSTIVNVGRINKVIGCITQDGQRGSIDPSDLSSWYSENLFKDTIIHSAMAPGSWWIVTIRSNAIIHYQHEKPDSSWMPAELTVLPDSDSASFYPQAELVCDDCVALLSYDILRFSKGGASDTLEEFRIDELKSVYNPVILGCYDGILYIYYFSHSGDHGVIAFDTDSHTYSVIPWEYEDHIIEYACRTDGSSDWLAVCCGLSGNHEWPVEWYVCRLNESFSVRERKSLGLQSKTADLQVNALPMGSKLYVSLTQFFSDDAVKAKCLDTETLEFVDCPDRIRDAINAAMRSKYDGLDLWSSADGSYIAAEEEGGKLHILNASGEELSVIRTETADMISAAFSLDGDVLMTVENDLFLHRYDLKTGTHLGKTELYSYSSGSILKNEDIRWQISDKGFVFVIVDSVANLISTEDYDIFAYIPYCLGYLEDSDMFFCRYSGSGGDKYGFFPRHSTEWLIAYGKEMMNGWELDSSQKAEYGLE